MEDAKNLQYAMEEMIPKAIFIGIVAYERGLEIDQERYNELGYLYEEFLNGDYNILSDELRELLDDNGL